MQTAPSAERNKEPIALVLAKYPPFSGSQQTSCLELASGTGQHAAHFASRFPHVTFQPSEYAGGSSGPEAAAYGTLSPVFASIVAHTGGMANVLRPIELDAAADTWPVEADAACAWSASQGLDRPYAHGYYSTGRCCPARLALADQLMAVALAHSPSPSHPAAGRRCCLCLQRLPHLTMAGGEPAPSPSP
jgi:hypothetical protein